MKTEKIDSTLFRWDNSARATYTSITHLWDSDKCEPKTRVIGYCNGGSVTTVAKPDTYAVMFDHKGDEIWIHLPKSMFKRWTQKTLQ
jgi:hypothetical protein